MKSKITKKTVEINKCNGRFSISFDESTSTRNQRFINLNLHFSTDFQSLGLIRVLGSMNTERLIQLAKEKLSEYKVSLDDEVVASVTDGAGIMMKFDRNTNPLHVACLPHAIHLVVCDVLYQSQESRSEEDNMEDEGIEELIFKRRKMMIVFYLF